MRDIPHEQLMKMLEECVTLHRELAEASARARADKLYDEEGRFVAMRIEVLSIKLDILALLRTTNEPDSGIRSRLESLRKRARLGKLSRNAGSGRGRLWSIWSRQPSAASWQQTA